SILPECLDSDPSDRSVAADVLLGKSPTRKRTKRKTTTKKKMAMTTKMTATLSEHRKPTITFSKLIDELQHHYGLPAPPPSTDPLELIIWENIAYLASDERRAAAFDTLKRSIGTRPEQI